MLQSTTAVSFGLPLPTTPIALLPVVESVEDSIRVDCDTDRAQGRAFVAGPADDDAPHWLADGSGLVIHPKVEFRMSLPAGGPRLWVVRSRLSR